MRYKCLVLDHDDTVVSSTAVIHYPSFLAFLDVVRPGLSARYTLEDYFEKNFDPGIMALFTDEIGLSPKEIDDEFHFWQSFVKTRIPAAYPGIREILLRHKAEGGILTVVSHSMRETILRDYRENGLPEPDLVYGWELPPEQRKPSPWPLERIMEKFDLRPEEMLMLDDLKPGFDSARACGVSFAAAGWANDVVSIEAFMRKNCDFYFKTVKDLAAFLWP